MLFILKLLRIVCSQYLITLLFVVCILFYQQSAIADFTLNMTRGVSPISQDIYQLHMTILWICVVIGIGVFSVFFFSLFRYRKSKGVTPSHYHGSALIETIWAIIPILILIAMAFPATHVLFAMDDDAAPDMTVKITGHQWQWEYAYLDEGIQFNSVLSTPQSQLAGDVAPNKFYLYQVNNPLVLPINKKVRLLLTSSDVIHSWWVHELGVKRDAMPGIITESWVLINEPGIYRGSCAELCGRGHAYMPIVVEAKTENEFNTWLASQQTSDVSSDSVAPQTYTLETLMENGEHQYNMFCSACHGVDGQGFPPTFPALQGNSVVTGEPISRHIDTVLQGIPGTVMRGFADQLNDDDIAAIVTYERNAWDNATGDVVQPEMIQQRR